MPTAAMGLTLLLRGDSRLAFSSSPQSVNPFALALLLSAGVALAPGAARAQANDMSRARPLRNSGPRN